jgi:hypothetical protein
MLNITSVATDGDLEFCWTLTQGGLRLRVHAAPMPTFEHAFDADPRAAMEAIVRKCIAHLDAMEHHLLASCEQVYPAMRELALTQHAR